MFSCDIIIKVYCRLIDQFVNIKYTFDPVSSLKLRTFSPAVFLALFVKSGKSHCFKKYLCFITSFYCFDQLHELWIAFVKIVDAFCLIRSWRKGNCINIILDNVVPSLFWISTIGRKSFVVVCNVCNICNESSKIT